MTAVLTPVCVTCTLQVCDDCVFSRCVSPSEAWSTSRTSSAMTAFPTPVVCVCVGVGVDVHMCVHYVYITGV